MKKDNNIIKEKELSLAFFVNEKGNENMLEDYMQVFLKLISNRIKNRYK